MKTKLLNFTICQIIILVIVLLLHCINCEKELKEHNDIVKKQKVTFYERPFERILNRRKRFLVYRPLSSLLLTASLVKPLVFPRPSGITTIIEWDMYYTLPTTWRKNTPKPKTKKIDTPSSSSSNKPSNTGPELMAPENNDHSKDNITPDKWSHDHPGEIWVPPNDWKSNVFTNLNMGQNVPASMEYSSNETRKSWDYMPSQWNEYSVMDTGNSKYSPPVTQFVNPLINRRISVGRPPTWQMMRNYKKAQGRGQEFYVPRGGRSFVASDNHNDDDDDDLENWEHYHAHRDRRDLYHQFVNVFG